MHSAYSQAGLEPACIMHTNQIIHESRWMLQLPCTVTCLPRQIPASTTCTCIAVFTATKYQFQRNCPKIHLNLSQNSQSTFKNKIRTSFSGQAYSACIHTVIVHSSIAGSRKIPTPWCIVYYYYTAYLKQQMLNAMPHVMMRACGALAHACMASGLHGRAPASRSTCTVLFPAAA